MGDSFAKSFLRFAEQYFVDASAEDGESELFGLVPWPRPSPIDADGLTPFPSAVTDGKGGKAGLSKCNVDPTSWLLLGNIGIIFAHCGLVFEIST